MFAVLRQRNFALLWIGQVVSMTGDWILFVSLPFYVYQITGSELATGGMFIIQALPRILFGSLVGVFVDRWDRRWTMIAADFGRAVILLPLLLIHSRDLFWIIYVVGVLETSISLFFSPARSALVPQIVGEDRLTEANSLDGIADNLTRLIGPSIGGALAIVLGTMGGLAIADSLSYAFSGIMILLISVPAIVRVQPEQTKPEKRSLKESWLAVWSEWLDGLRIVKNERVVLGIFIVVGLLIMGDSPITAVLVPFVKDTLHGNQAVLGWIMTLRGLGGLIGGFVTSKLNKLVKPGIMIAIGLFLAGALMFITFNIPNIPLALIIITIIGVLAMFFIINVTTLLQSSVNDTHRGRVFGTYDTTTSLIAVLAMAAASTAGEKFGPVPVLNVAGILYVAAGIVAFFLLRDVIIKTAAGGNVPVTLPDTPAEPLVTNMLPEENVVNG